VRARGSAKLHQRHGEPSSPAELNKPHLHCNTTSDRIRTFGPLLRGMAPRFSRVGRILLANDVRAVHLAARTGHRSGKSFSTAMTTCHCEVIGFAY